MLASHGICAPPGPPNHCKADLKGIWDNNYSQTWNPKIWRHLPNSQSCTRMFRAALFGESKKLPAR